MDTVLKILSGRKRSDLVETLRARQQAKGKARLPADPYKYVGTPYILSCHKIEEMHSRCLGCSHRGIPNNSPVFIEGPFPTPSLATGFFVITTRKGRPIDYTKIQPREIAFAILNRHLDRVACKDNFFYFYHDRRWHGIDAGARLGRVSHFVNFCLAMFSKENMVRAALIPIRQWREVRAELLSMVYHMKSWAPLKDTFHVPFQNGIFVADKNRLVPHSPEMRNTRILPGEYNEEAETKDVDLLLKGLAGEKNLPLLRAQIGLLVLHPIGSIASEVLFIWGPTNAGKSAFLQLMENLVGSDKTAIAPSMLALASSKRDNILPIEKDVHLLLVDDHVPYSYLESVFANRLAADPGPQRKIHVPTEHDRLSKAINPLHGVGLASRMKPTHAPFRGVLMVTSNFRPYFHVYARSGLARRIRMLSFERTLPQVCPVRRRLVTHLLNPERHKEAWVAYAADCAAEVTKRYKEKGRYSPERTPVERRWRDKMKALTPRHVLDS